MKLKRIAEYDQVSLYAFKLQPSVETMTELKTWLEKHCPNQYKLDNLHLIIDRPAETLFALAWI